VEENTQHYISGLVKYDPETEQQFAGEQMPNTDDLEIVGDHLPLDDAAMIGELWESFEDGENVAKLINRDFSPYHFNYDNDYNPVQVQFRDRGATGFLSDPRNK
jgi:hypothetical protein